jgi:hypothetical protein
MKKIIGRNIIVPALLLLGALISTYRAHGSIPYHPMDLVSYLGGYHAARDGGNPYDFQDACQSLERRGINVEPYLFVYPPPMLLIMTPLEIMPYRLYRLAWIASSVLAAWLSVYLLSRGTKGLMPLFIAGAFVFLTVSEPLNDNLVCGQITSFMLLALALMVQRGFKGAVAGLSAAFLLLSKVGFMPLVLFLRGRRTLLVLAVLMICLSFSSVLLVGLNAFHDWMFCLLNINESWGFIGSNNLSVTHAVSLLAEEVLVKGDIERVRTDDEYRFELASSQRVVLRIVFLCLAIVSLLTVIFRFCKMHKKGSVCSRECILSQAVLFLLAFIPCVWVHYGMFLLIPFRQLVVRGRSVLAVLFIMSAVVWGMPNAPVPVWLKFLIPLVWLFSTAFLHDESESDGMQPFGREAESR